jgi:hypothetical protein
MPAPFRLHPAGLALILACCCAAASSDSQLRAQQVLVADQKAVAAAAAAVDTAAKALTSATDKRLRDFDRSPEFKAAQKAVVEHSAAVEAARLAALKDLRTSPAYEEASAKRAAAQAKADALKDQPNSIQRQDALQEVGRLDALINALEDGALQADPALKSARESLIAATVAFKGLKEKFIADAPDDPELARLRKVRDDAQQKLTRAQSKLEADRTRFEIQSLLGG